MFRFTLLVSCSYTIITLYFNVEQFSENDTTNEILHTFFIQFKILKYLIILISFFKYEKKFHNNYYNPSEKLIIYGWIKIFVNIINYM